ncbi:MAG: monofunctional biosynthetic peptidoglycan transglycosylase [Gemmatimonadota bacterium]|nr:monofunctional biosynthetic peptidoglycan transglycosylase [Gemmatimonadota bacterium]
MGRRLGRFFRWLARGPRRDGEEPRSRWRRFASGLARVATALLLASTLSVALLRWVPPVTTAFILRERAFGDTPVAHYWTPWRQISPDAALAVVASEDQRFPIHHGFDLVEIERAIQGGARRGASTISQQVAKNLFLWPGGGYFRKGIEAGFTVLIEAMWPKRRILEVYLNVAEFGPGVFGVGEAARRYYGKEPAALTAREAARLAAVLPSPKRMSVANPGPYVTRRTDQILAQMRQLGGRSYLEGL